MQVIVLSGLKGHGKSTISKYLVEKHNYIELTLADVLKDIVSMVFQWDRDMLEGVTDKSRLERESPDTYWSSILNIYDFSPRKALQLVGTQLFRQHLANNIWVCVLNKRLQELKKTSPDAKVVITDIRFPDELYFFIDNYKAVSVGVRKPEIPSWVDLATQYNISKGIMKALLTCYYKALKFLQLPSLFDIHESERSMPGVVLNYTLANNGTIEELYAKVDKLLDTITPKE